MFENLRADLVRVQAPESRHQDAQWRWAPGLRGVADQQGFWAVAEYRYRRWAHSVPLPWGTPLRFVGLLTRKVIEITTGVSISSSAEFGPGLYIGHFGAIIVGAGVVVGQDCNLSQGVTLGAHHGGGSPTLGEFVYVGPGAKVFGDVHVGDAVMIGANAVVNRDVPPNTTAVGVPVRDPRGPGRT